MIVFLCFLGRAVVHEPPTWTWGKDGWLNLDYYPSPFNICLEVALNQTWGDYITNVIDYDYDCIKSNYDYNRLLELSWNTFTKKTKPICMVLCK